MSRLLLGLVFVFVVWGAGSARAEKCYPANLYSDYWEQRDILATMTEAERADMPTSQRIARAWKKDALGWTYEGRRWRSGEFEEFSVVYRTKKLIEIRRETYAKSTPARARQVKGCLDKKKDERKRTRAQQKAEDDARMAESHAQWLEEAFEQRRPNEQEGTRLCLQGDCRVLQNGAWIKVGKP